MATESESKNTRVVSSAFFWTGIGTDCAEGVDTLTDVVATNCYAVGCSHTVNAASLVYSRSRIPVFRPFKSQG